MRARRDGIRKASVAVAGVCLTGSVASAWTTARAGDFETEFEAGTELGAGAVTELGGPVAQPASQVLAANAGTTLWEQTLVGYLDKIVAKDCDECEKAEKQSIAQAQADANPDWDIEEPAGPAVALDADWDLAEEPAAVAQANPDWDLEEPAGAVVAAADADWDLAETSAPVAPAAVAAVVDADWDLAEAAPVVVAALSPDDWDLEESTVPAPAPEAVAASANEAAPAAEPKAEANPDWDIDDATVAAVDSEEVTKVEPGELEFELFFLP